MLDKGKKVEIPRGFKEAAGKVLKLHRTLYGLRQSPRKIVIHLKQKLEQCRFKQSPNDPYLFYTEKGICLVYVDNCLFFSPTKNSLDAVFNKMRATDLDFHLEDDVTGFLGVLMTPHENGTIEMTQMGLIDHIIVAMGLDKVNISKTPAEYGCLGEKDLDGMWYQEEWSYRSMLDMIIYLCNNTSADIQFTMSRCARFSFDPQQAARLH
jgi:hypothetical protein